MTPAEHKARGVLYVTQVCQAPISVPTLMICFAEYKFIANGLCDPGIDDE